MPSAQGIFCVHNAMVATVIAWPVKMMFSGDAFAISVLVGDCCLMAFGLYGVDASIAGTNRLRGRFMCAVKKQQIGTRFPWNHLKFERGLLETPNLQRSKLCRHKVVRADVVLPRNVPQYSFFKKNRLVLFNKTEKEKSLFYFFQI